MQKIIVSLVGLSLCIPAVSFAQTDISVDAVTDVVTMTTQAEQRIASLIPENVKTVFNTSFASVEALRLQQVTYATAQRDRLEEQVMIAVDESIQAVEDNRDAVLEGEATSLYSGAGERLQSDVSMQTRISYYAYKIYTSFVSSPILFYVVGLFLVIYIVAFIVRKFRSRRSYE